MEGHCELGSHPYGLAEGERIGGIPRFDGKRYLCIHFAPFPATCTCRPCLDMDGDRKGEIYRNHACYWASFQVAEPDECAKPPDEDYKRSG